MGHKLKDFKDKNETDLRRLLQESSEEIRDLRRRVAQQDLKNVRAIRLARVKVAQLKTLLGEMASKIKGN
ncbi:MAG: 50S ribosomal protein L29 [Candidatus Kerfeldbacteria bacterium]|nr:50S ribosomal protein L29 [Candidatus Kerfeldbacteria bacterium]